MKREIKAVFFDAGNTLLYLDYELIARKVCAAGVETQAEELKVSEYDARRAVDEYLATDDYVDEMVWDIYFSTMFMGVGLESREKILATIQNLREENEFQGLWNHAPEESHRTLETLKSQGYIIGIISNADGRLNETIARTGIDKYLDFMLDSKIVGYEKPDPRIFNVALEKAGVPPEACVHVGDIVTADIKGASGVGINPVLLDPTGRHIVDCPVISDISEIIDVVKTMNGN
ncbi:MAG TPA: HAD-IA family hydrolase [bacterium]|nr:HAD-IA family hydrolase [bacterium]